MPDIEALIRERAYIIWEQSGRPLGHDRDHWFQAAKEVEAMALPNEAAASPNGEARLLQAVKTSAKKTSARKR